MGDFIIGLSVVIGIAVLVVFGGVILEAKLKTDCQKAYNVYQCEYNNKGAYVPKGKSDGFNKC